jgi:hypothetical protein
MFIENPAVIPSTPEGVEGRMFFVLQAFGEGEVSMFLVLSQWLIPVLITSKNRYTKK